MIDKEEVKAEGVIEKLDIKVPIKEQFKGSMPFNGKLKSWVINATIL